MDNPPDDGPCEVTITAPDREWLQTFVRKLVSDGFAAAGHVDLMHSTYRWAGAVNETEEARAILHSRFAAVPHISERCRVEHPYDVACVAAVKIQAGEPAYLDWILESTSI